MNRLISTIYFAVDGRYYAVRPLITVAGHPVRYKEAFIVNEDGWAKGTITTPAGTVIQVSSEFDLGERPSGRPLLALRDGDRV